ncbi:MAG TPA: lysophospholipid acyltransferase family protein [Desulfatiglandales bacterium]|nr:lysophospholipid acyltransferase family protein [Desulfatiglandales bacterium]
MLKKPMKSRYWYDPILFNIAIPLFSLLIRLLFLSFRLVNVKGAENETAALSRSGNGVIYASWHQRLIYHVRRLSDRNVTVMVSQSRDGEYAARFINALGMNDVRGSSSRGGTDALNELKNSMKDGSNGGMVLDGPLGPPRVAKIGTVILARMTGAPVIPIVWGADRCWELNSWDRFIIPKPFARISYYYGDPIWVPSSASSEEMEEFRRILEKRLNSMTRWCDQQFGEERPWGKGVKENIE